MGKALHAIFGTVLLVASGSTAEATKASKAEDAKSAAAHAAMMKAFQKAGTPGTPHKLLANMAGSWRVKVKMWQAPGAPAQESTGRSTAKMILGRRFLQQKYRGTFMGQPFNGLATVGYDNIAKKYVSTWADSMSTTLMTSQGTIDDSGKVITYTTHYSCPIVNGPKQGKTIVRIINKRKYIMEMYDRDAKGKSFKTMELTYTRAS